ncbi:MAG: hypothetical protein J6H21_01370 [Firmicutes bacterium]|nr:hypothetical protein [Bacillota bacterium]
MINKKKIGAPRILGAVILILLVLGLSLVSAGCSNGSGGQTQKPSPLAAYEKADMSGYGCMDEYTKDTVFVDVTMEDIDKLMQSKETFVLYAGFANCPWCNALLPRLNDVALEEGATIAYLDTRKNPEWKSNVDIDGYDKFKEYFGEYLDIDDSGEPHLYVPDTYFIKEGEVVFHHQGVTPGLANPNDEWTKDLIKEAETTLKEGFDKLK